MRKRKNVFPDNLSQNKGGSMTRKVKINRKTDALIGVDIQRTFCTIRCGKDVCSWCKNLGYGELPVPGGNAMVEPFNVAMRFFSVLALSFDSHPENHCSFKDQGGPFPKHGVEGTEGWKSHEKLDIRNRDFILVRKGFEAARDELCCFCGDPVLAKVLPQSIRRIFIGGLATDYCVKAAAIHARTLGYDVFVIKDAIRAVDEKAGRSAIWEMKANGVKFVRSENLVAV